MAARVSSPHVRLLGEMPEPVVWSQIRYDEQFDRGGKNSLYYPPLLHYHSAEWHSPFLRRVASEPAIKQRPQTSPWDYRRGRSREFLSSPPASVPHSFLECAHVATQFSESLRRARLMSLCIARLTRPRLIRASMESDRNCRARSHWYWYSRIDWNLK